MPAAARSRRDEVDVDAQELHHRLLRRRELGEASGLSELDDMAERVQRLLERRGANVPPAALADELGDRLRAGANNQVAGAVSVKSGGGDMRQSWSLATSQTVA